MNKKTQETLINIGTGKDLSIKQYVKLFLKVLLSDRKIKIRYDRNKPNGTPKKLMSIKLAKKYGWKSKIILKDAIIKTFNHYSKSQIKV